MSRSLNKVMLLGNVGAEPEIRSTASGTKLAKVSLATNRVFNDRAGTKQEKTEWHRLTFWDKLAEIVERYVHKGDRLYVEGRIEYSQVGEGEGAKYYTDIVVYEMLMLGDGSGGAGQGGGNQSRGRELPPRQPAGAKAPWDDDDLPF